MEFHSSRFHSSNVLSTVELLSETARIPPHPQRLPKVLPPRKLPLPLPSTQWTLLITTDTQITRGGFTLAEWNDAGSTNREIAVSFPTRPHEGMYICIPRSLQSLVWAKLHEKLNAVLIWVSIYAKTVMSINPNEELKWWDTTCF